MKAKWMVTCGLGVCIMSIYFSGLAIFDMRNDFTVEFLDFFTSSIDATTMPNLYKAVNDAWRV